MSLVKIGIIGCAEIAQRYMIPAILNLKEKYELVGIASQSLKKLKKFNNLFGTDSFYKYEDILKNDLIDAVYIPLPNSMCHEWIEKSLNKGMHVLVEKSMATTLEEVSYLNDLAKNKNLILLENFQFRFHKQLKSIVKLVESNAIGELRCVKSSFGFPPFKNPKNIRYSKKLGGGSLLDAGVYPIKVSQIFLGENITVAEANLSYNNKGVDIWGGAYLKQKNGELFSQISFGFDNFYQCNLELWGSKGRIFSKRIFTSPPFSSSKIFLESQIENKTIEIKECNHFEEILLYFFDLIKMKNSLHLNEYNQNINQARLINELRIKANQK